MSLALARLPFARLVRTRRSVVPLIGWAAFAVGSTIAMRRLGSVSVDRALLSVFVPFVLPLVAYGAVSGALAGEGLVRAAEPLARFGISGKRAALAASLVACAGSALACAVVGVLMVVAAHGSADAPLGRDVALTAYASALAGAAHAAFFTLGAAFGARGGGRSAALLVNWFFGSARGYASLFVPYAHARSLLGGDPAVTLSERGSAWCLLAIGVVCVALASLRVRR